MQKPLALAENCEFVIFPPVRRVLLFIILPTILIFALVAAVDLWRSPDPLYRAQEWLRPDFRKYQQLINDVSSSQQVDPDLVRAVVWRESRFAPDKTGLAGERGLMQVTEIAATDWVNAEKIETFQPTDLFDPFTNVKVGSWYLARALGRWQDREDPEVFALAEYNAGRSRLLQWVAAADEKAGRAATGAEVLEVMDFPTTKAYIQSVLERYRLYQLD